MTPTNTTDNNSNLMDEICISEIQDLRNQNIIFQSVSRYNACLEQPTHPYIQLVISNTVENWINYFRIDNNIYSKGLTRLTTWSKVFKTHTRLQTIPLNTRYFVLSALIILFQVYGDGNHRTASYLYNKYTGNTLNLLLIDPLNIEFTILNTERINSLIEQLICIYHAQM